MTITLRPEHERIIQREIQSGRFRSPDEVLDRALAALQENEHERKPATTTKRSSVEAIAHIRELRKGVTLHGLRIKDLINEGRP